MPIEVEQPKKYMCKFKNNQCSIKCDCTFDTIDGCLECEANCLFDPEIKAKYEGKCFSHNMGDATEYIKILEIRSEYGEIKEESIHFISKDNDLGCFYQQTNCYERFDYGNRDKYTEITPEEYTKKKCECVLKNYPEIVDYLKDQHNGTTDTNLDPGWSVTGLQSNEDGRLQIVIENDETEEEEKLDPDTTMDVLDELVRDHSAEILEGLYDMANEVLSGDLED